MVEVPCSMSISEALVFSSSYLETRKGWLLERPPSTGNARHCAGGSAGAWISCCTTGVIIDET